MFSNTEPCAPGSLLPLSTPAWLIGSAPVKTQRMNRLRQCRQKPSDWKPPLPWRGRNAARAASLPSSKLVLRLDVDVFGVDHAFVLLGFLPGRRTGVGGGAAAGEATTLRSSTGLSRFVHRLRQLVRSLREPLARRIHGARIGSFQCLFGIGQCRLYIGALAARDLVSVLLQHLLDLVNHRVELVARFDFLTLGLVLGGVRFGVFGHVIDFL